MPKPRLALLPIPAALLAMPSPLPAATPAPPAGSYVWELMAILLPLAFIILFLLVVLRMLRRRFGLAGPDAPLSVVQVLPLGPRERLVVVRSRAGRAFAVGVSAQSVSLVCTLDGEDLGPQSPVPDASQGDHKGQAPLLQRFKVKRP